MTNIRKIIPICIMGFLLSAVPSASSAGVITYTDRTLFEAAAATAGVSLTTEEFATDPGSPFTVSDADGGAEFTLANGIYSAGPQNYLSDGALSGGTATVQLTGTPTGDLVALGYDYRGTAFMANVDVSATMNVNGVTHSSSVGQGVNGFVGMIFDGGDTINAIASLEASAVWTAGPGGPFQTMDNLTIGTFSSTTAAVPEPSSLALLGLGAFGFGAMRRRRKSCASAEQSA